MKKLLFCLSLLVLAASANAQDAQKGKFLGDRHVQRGVQCAVCHGEKVSGQLPEDQEKHEPCVKCHGFYDKVAAKTQPKDPEEQNPHGQHDGNLPCTTCHKGHKESVNYCGQCHMWNFKVP